MAQYHKGQSVKIYEDPITEKKLEGTAKLVELIINELPFYLDGKKMHREYWKVHFDEDEKDEFHERWIMTRVKK